MHRRVLNNMRVVGKVALVTGGAQGLGKAFCKILLENGAKVAVVDFNGEQGMETVTQFSSMYGQDRVMFQHCDVTNQGNMDETFQAVKEKYGGLDIVINNAGVGGEKGELWENTVDVNLKGTIRGTNLAIENMRKDKGGRGGVIVNVSSMAGINPNPCGPVYNATKSAINMFSLSWAKNPELAANGVHINVLCPAFVETDLMDTITDSENIHMPAVASTMVEKVGVLSPEHVAQALFELVEDQNKTGAVLKISRIRGKAYHEV